ncbi:DUF3768 domain-containing protein [Agrobacterium pusense]|uniref:DUF3768 domain-containing protein n=1 Tax=Agrobacterium pusense TaxID=648995 RepID=UPI00286D2C42|nr:DUF3768 domain-containing protein [Agrobacterium pusense]
MDHSTVLLTSGVQSLPETTHSPTVEGVRGFNASTPDNDPHGEHDFRAVTVEGHKIFRKIDYNDPILRYGSEAAENPAITKRVLTIMLAEEYWAHQQNASIGRR